MKIVTVIPLVRGIKKELTYFAKADPGLGRIVIVPTRKKFIEALVIDVKDLREHKSAVKISEFGLRKIQELKGAPIWDKAFFESCRRASKYFAHPLGEIIATFLPKNFLDARHKLALGKEYLASKSDFRAEKLVLQTLLDDRIDFYKTFIRESFAKKSSVFFVLPRLADIEFFAKRLSFGLEPYTFCLHGKLTPKKQIEIYNKIMTTDHPVLVFGTGSFLFLPRPDLKIFILEKEASDEYRTVANNLDVRIFVEILAEERNAKLILADTILRLETIEGVNQGLFSEVLPMNFRLAALPEIIHQEKFSILELPTFKMIQENQSGQTFLFALRKGLATLIICHDCQTPVICEKCSRPLILAGERERAFVCHSCRATRSAGEKCANCLGWNLVPLGIGAERVYGEIKKDFPGRSVILFEKEKDINNFFETPGAILIGGENALALLKDRVNSSAVISFDTLWNIPDFRMNEKIIQILIELLEKTKKKTVIQTRHDLEIKENLLDFVREEQSLRKKYGYPPFTRLIEIIMREDNRAKKITEEFEKWAPEEWRFGRKLTLVIRVPTEDWNGKKVVPDLWEKLINLPPDIRVIVQ